MMSSSRVDVDKLIERHQCLRTAASASLKLGKVLRYQAACRIGKTPPCTRRVASSVTIEYSASSTGVVRAMAGALLKLGKVLRYQAACRIGKTPPCTRRVASSVTIEYS